MRNDRGTEYAAGEVDENSGERSYLTEGSGARREQSAERNDW